MGGSESKEENVKNDGQVQNNVTIGHTVDVSSNEIVILLAMICAIKLIELAVYLFRSFKKDLKKKVREKMNPI